MDALALKIETTDIDLVRGSYTHIRVWKGDSATGPWEPITAPEETPAILDGTREGPFEDYYSLLGENLILHLDREAVVEVDFTTQETLGQVIEIINATADQIIDQRPASQVPAHTGRLRLSSILTGRQSCISVSGTAAETLGLSTNPVLGAREHIRLIPGEPLYDFIDEAGDVSFWYCVDYWNSTSGAYSDKSDAFQGEPVTIVDLGHLSTANIQLIDAQGRPVPNMEVRIYPLPPFTSQEFGVVVNAADPISAVTDGMGRASINLVRGLKARVVLVGTPFIRDITVPDEEEFNLMELAGESPDGFTVAIPRKVLAVRRSL